MAMVCPQCSGTFKQAMQCPTCGVRLQYVWKPLERSSSNIKVSAEKWLHTSLGRIGIGIFVAQGLAYSLQLLCNAYLLAALDQTQVSIWSTVWGLVLLQCIQAFSLVVGGALAGAGQRLPAVLGAVVGSVHGSIFLLLQRLHGEHLTEVVLYGQPVLHVAFGALGALMGGYIWQPLPQLSMPDELTKKKSKTIRRRSLTWAALQGPVAWGRVFAGIVIVTAGFLWGPSLLRLVLEAGNGTLKVTDRLQAQIVTWEIIGLATLLGAAVSGSTTRNGLKQGLCVGIGTGVLLIGDHLGGKNLITDQIAVTIICIVALTVAGGWFGGQLFPPVVTASRRKGPEWAA